MLPGMADPDPAPTPRPSLGAMFSNWATYDAPFFTKLKMVASNNLIKVRNRQSCCGHPGQPGC
jgi:hypothetical protein